MPLMSGVQIKEYCDALVAAFDQNSLPIMLRSKLDKTFGNLVGPKAFQYQVFDLVTLSEREGWHVELIQAAHQHNPGNPQLTAVYDKYGLAPNVNLQDSGSAFEAAAQAVSADGFERRIKEHLPQFDIVRFRIGLTLVEGCVCRIESNGNALGSGFLVGPDLVMTNYHVMDRIIEDESLAARIRCRFDYKRLQDGSRQMGTEVPLHDSDWNVCYSKYAPAEKRGRPDDELPTVDELDYTLVRLAEPVGDRPIPPGSEGAPARGWIKFPDDLPVLKPPVPMIIAQHPDGAPLKLAMDTNGVNAINENGTRVRYETTTESGSSGSPCFDFDWKPFALHHYGDPGSEFNSPQFNQGIPFTMIRDHLTRNGHEGII